MGLLIAIARKVQLNSQRFAYEHKLMVINRAKSDLAGKISDYQMSQNDYEADSPEAKTCSKELKGLIRLIKG